MSILTDTEKAINANIQKNMHAVRMVTFIHQIDADNFRFSLDKHDPTSCEVIVAIHGEKAKVGRINMPMELIHNIDSWHSLEQDIEMEAVALYCI